MAIDYHRQIKPVTTRIRQEYQKTVEPELKKLLEFEHVEDANVSMDDSVTEKIGKIFRRFRINYYGQEYPIDGDPKTANFRRKIELQVERSAKALAVFHKKRFSQNSNFVIQVDPLKSEPWLKGYLQDWTMQNVTLIKDIPIRTFDTLEQQVATSVLRGDSQTFLKEQIAKTLNVSDTRARLIARDQTNKLYGGLTALRAKFNEWPFYEWDTSDDERVREDHKRLDGKIFSFNSSEWPVIDTRTNEKGIPGSGIQCRCIALIIFDKSIISRLKKQPDGSYAVPTITAA